LGKLIGIGGRLTAGKDAAADHLVGKGWIKFGMSDILHESMMALNPIIDHQVVVPQGGPITIEPVRYAELVREVGYTAAKEHPEVRALLQRIGTEVGRNMFGEDFWVSQVQRRLRKAMKANNVVITGIRYKNELWMIEELGGLPVWINRPNVEATSGHDSETSVHADDFGVWVNNNGTLADLGAKMDKVAQHAGRA